MYDIAVAPTVVGENGIPSEDALVLPLESAKGQEKFLEMLKSQHIIIADLQRNSQNSNKYCFTSDELF